MLNQKGWIFVLMTLAAGCVEHNAGELMMAESTDGAPVETDSSIAPDGSIAVDATRGVDGSGSGVISGGRAIYLMPVEEGNTFSCSTCHALNEPSQDGFLRAGHQIGDATRRSAYKNGRLDSMLDAVNSCLTEWMAVREPWTEDEPRWIALYNFLEEASAEGDAPNIAFEVQPAPSDLTGGDIVRGQAIFNQSCILCHGMDAMGTLLAPPLAGAGLEAEYVARRVRTSGSSSSPIYDELTGGRMPFWAGDRLSDPQLLDIIAYVLSAEAPILEPDPEPEPEPEVMSSECDSTHAKVGWTAELQNFFHGIGGTATIVDNCTIVIESFTFDGNGIIIEVYAGLDGDYDAGFSISDNLYNFPTGYHGETLTLTLPDGRTMDDLDGISIWCATVGVNFGDGTFVSP